MYIERPYRAYRHIKASEDFWDPFINKIIFVPLHHEIKIMFNLKFSYMTTLKSLLILNQLSNNKAVLIPSITGEYLDSETNYGSTDEPNPKFSKSEPWTNFQGDSYTQIQDALNYLGYDGIIYIPISEIKAYFDRLCHFFRTQITWSINNHHIGNDTFYHYLPDLYEMIQYAAYGLIISSGDLDADYDTLLDPIIDLIKQFDKAFPEGERLIEQFYRISTNDFLALNNHIMG